MVHRRDSFPLITSFTCRASRCEGRNVRCNVCGVRRRPALRSGHFVIGFLNLLRYNANITFAKKSRFSKNSYLPIIQRNATSLLNMNQSSTTSLFDMSTTLSSTTGTSTTLSSKTDTSTTLSSTTSSMPKNPTTKYSIHALQSTIN